MNDALNCVLVIGRDSRIGSALSTALSCAGSDVHTTSRRPKVGDSRCVFLDLTEPGSTDVPLPRVNVAIFCVAITSYSGCRQNPELARRVNVTAPVKLAARLVKQGTRVVLLSTNAVYDGTRPLICASTPPNPISEYGRLKAEAEAEFLALGHSASVLRLTKVLEPNNALFNGWVTTLAAGLPIKAISNLNFAPISSPHAIAAVMAVARSMEGGIFQASAMRDINYAEAGRHLAAMMNRDRACVLEQTVDEANIPVEQTPSFASLDAARLSSLTGSPAPEPLAMIAEVFGPAVQQTFASRVIQSVKPFADGALLHLSKTE